MSNPFKVNNLPAVRRLPIYWHFLQGLHEKGWDYVSTTVIADSLKLDAIQVRKDLALTGIVGKPRVGYTIPTLITAIETFLGWDNAHDAFLVGVGHLGTALLGYQGFARFGLNIVAAFDNDPEKCNQEIHGRTVLPFEKMADLAERMHVKIGIITVPAEAAQETADELVRIGITGIWNFTPTVLMVPGGVVVQNEDLAPGLAVLSHKLTQLHQQQTGETGEIEESEVNEEEGALHA